MNIPKINIKQAQRQITNQFGGLNNSAVASDTGAEFEEIVNFTNDEAPAIKTRELMHKAYKYKQGFPQQNQICNDRLVTYNDGIIEHGTFCTTDGTQLTNTDLLFYGGYGMDSWYGWKSEVTNNRFYPCSKYSKFCDTYAYPNNIKRGYRQFIQNGTSNLYIPEMAVFDTSKVTYDSSGNVNGENGSCMPIQNVRNMGGVEVVPCFEDGTPIRLVQYLLSGHFPEGSISMASGTNLWSSDGHHVLCMGFENGNRSDYSNVAAYECTPPETSALAGSSDNWGILPMTKATLRLYYKGRSGTQDGIYPPIDYYFHEDDYVYIDDMSYSSGVTYIPYTTISAGATEDYWSKNANIDFNRDVDGRGWRVIEVNNTNHFITIQQSAPNWEAFASLIRRTNFAGWIDSANYIKTYVTIKLARRVPNLVCGALINNRVWGCGADGHSIYASALGNMYSWYQYEGTLMDSYAVAVGSPGGFTGCAVWNSKFVAFKTDRIYIIYGDYPSNFQSYEIMGPGCIDPGSVAVVGNYVYYVGENGIYRFNGSAPQLISNNLGSWKPKTEYLKDNLYASHTDTADEETIITKWRYLASYYSAGENDGKYYLCDGKSILIFDSANNTWQKSTIPGVAVEGKVNIVNTNGSMLICVEGANQTSDAWAYSVKSDRLGTGAAEGKLSWTLTTRNLMESAPDRKYISKLQIGIEAEDRGQVEVEVSYDQSDRFYRYKTITTEREQSLLIPVVPRRSDYVRVRLSGKGPCTIKNFNYYYELGSEYK